jgi:ATPase family AAA domain-containing protein 3A/B
MSWLFGSRNAPPSPSDILGVDIDKVAGGAGGSGGGGADGGGGEPPKDKKPGGGIESSYRFDSSALERAAAAAKDLEKSSHAKEVCKCINKTVGS